MKSKLFASLFLLGLSLPTMAVENLKRVTFSYESNQAIEGCQAEIAKELVDHKITLVDDPALAQGQYKVRLAANKEGLRTQLNWAAALFDMKGEKLFVSDGQESGWSAEGACKDLAEDLAEDLIKALRKASVLKF